MTTLEVELRGAPLQLLEDLLSYEGEPAVLEYLLDGPGGSGKSRGICHALQVLGDRFPGIRVLIVRKTRASLTESFCKTWEQDVLPQGDPMLTGPQRTHRHAYKHPNGSEYVLGGLDVDSRLFSTDYDVVYIQELFEITKDEYEKFRRALRNWKGGIPFQLLVSDTNPHVPWHWINKHDWQPGRRLLSRHYENPSLFDADANEWTPKGKAYLGSLRRLTGVRYRRLYLGQWCAAEGAVWENFDEAVHCIYAKDLPVMSWYFGAVDWGFTEPGVLGIWGVDSDDRLYLVAEVYRTGQTIEWWAQRAVEFHKEFTLRRIVCDPSRPDAIKLFNDYLGVPNDGPKRIAQEANNSKTTTGAGDMSGLDLVRSALAPAKDGKPRIFFVRDCLRSGKDPELVERAQPVCTAEEIPGYVFAKRQFAATTANPSSRPVDLTDPSVPDHGCFVAGTPVRMADGTEREIESVPVGALVWTPNGPERVTASGLMGVKPTVLVGIDGGPVIRCTPDHPFHVVGLGMVRADMLSSGHEVSGWASTGVEKPASTAVESGVAIPTAPTGARATSRARARSSIASSGRRTTGRFRPASKCTTRAATGRTIGSRTWNCSDRKITGASTGPIRTGTWPSAASAYCASAPEGSARAVAARYRSISRRTPASARTPARRVGGATSGLITSRAPATCAARFSRSTVTLAPGLAPRRVLGVSPASPAEVFNLTVEPSHVYLAGGVLVSNCDQTRYAALFAWQRDLAPPPEPERLPDFSYGALLGHKKVVKR